MMKTIWVGFGLLLFYSVLALASETVVDRRMPVPAKPDHGLQVLMPEVVIEPHGSRQLCWYTTLPNGSDEAIVSFRSFQNIEAGGHHLLGFITSDSAQDKPDGTLFDCSMGAPQNSDMLIFPINDTWGFDAPKGYAISLPAHARIIFQFHYHNHSHDKILVRDVMNLEFARKPNELKFMAPFLSAILDFKIPPKSRYTATYECPILADLDIYSLGGHIHDLGTHSTVELVRDGKAQTLYSQNWQPDFGFHPPVNIYENESLKLRKGDALRVSCEWDNPTDATLTYPEEMCGNVGFHISGPYPVTCAYLGGKAYYRGSPSGH